MLAKFAVLALLLVVAQTTSAIGTRGRDLMRTRSRGGDDDDDDDDSSSGASSSKTLTIMVTNLSSGQPMAPVFAMSHNGAVPPLFTFGSTPSEELAVLAESGSPAALEDLYSSMEGVMMVSSGGATGAPLPPGMSATFEIRVSDSNPYVTLASMAVNTNDCFVAVNGMKLASGQVHYLPGLDAGSEGNDESCANIPGPACMGGMGRNMDDAEGFVHVHPGIRGEGDLTIAPYDWRNPMMMVKVM